MTGNFFDMEKKKIVSTDAHKLTAINMPNGTFNFIKQAYNKELDKDPKGLIFHTLSQLQKDYNKLMKNNNISISFDEFVKDRAIEDGRYPNYEAVIPKEFTNEINVDYQKLYWYAKVLVDAKVIDDVTKINTSNANEYQNKKIEYLKDSYTSFLNPVTKQIILTYTLDGTIQYIGFNARLLCDLLKFAMEFNGKTFGKVGLSGNSRAIVIELENGLNVLNDSVGIVMPVMLVSGEFDNTIGDSDFENNVAMYYDLDTNSIISDKENYPINESIGFMPNKAGLSTPNIRVKEEVSKVENSSADLIDTRIKGYRIALKVAKAENKANIEKKIKGLEIAKKMSKFAKGGNIGFKGLSNKVASNYEGKKVPQRFQSIYGKTYSQSEAQEVGNKVAGKVYREQQANKMAKGGMVEYYDYKGVEIMYEPTYEEYFVNDLVFNTLEKAKKYIDSGEANETPTYIKNLYRRGAMAKGGMIKGGKVLASSSTKEGIIKLIGQYLYGSTITLVETDNDKIFEVHNKKGKTSFYVEFSRGKYRFIQPSMFAKGGSVDEDISWDIFIRDEYDAENFEINVRGYFENEEDAIKQAIKDYDIYVDESDYGKMYWNGNEITIYGAKKNYKKGGSIDEQTYIDLFEDYENIPAEVQMILDEYSESFEDGDYIGMSKAKDELEQIGYTFNYYVSGDAYGLRPTNIKLSQIQGYEDEDEDFDKGGEVGELGGNYRMKNDFGSFTTIKVMAIDKNLRISKDFFSVQVSVRKKDGDNIIIKNSPLTTYPISKYNSFIKDLEQRNAIKYKAGGEVADEQVYIDYINKEKGFKKDRIYFNTYAEAVEWGKKNFERFNNDMINYV
jgi:hypothetical protein